MITPIYAYRFRLERVVDGDTLDVLVDCGFDVWRAVTVRLYGVNCPEMKGASKAEGRAAKQATMDWFDNRTSLVMVSHQKAGRSGVDSFRRYLAVIYGTKPNGDQDSLQEWLLLTGHAKKFME
jgi:micrococcal nuclease